MAFINQHIPLGGPTLYPVDVGDDHDPWVDEMEIPVHQPLEWDDISGLGHFSTETRFIGMQEKNGTSADISIEKQQRNDVLMDIFRE